MSEDHVRKRALVGHQSDVLVPRLRQVFVRAMVELQTHVAIGFALAKNFLDRELGIDVATRVAIFRAKPGDLLADVQGVERDVVLDFAAVKRSVVTQRC